MGISNQQCSPFVHMFSHDVVDKILTDSSSSPPVCSEYRNPTIVCIGCTSERNVVHLHCNSMVVVYCGVYVLISLIISVHFASKKKREYIC